MTKRQRNGEADDGGAQSANRVRLRGKVSTPPEERALPSGTTIVTLRLSVPREVTPMTDGSRSTADWVDCAAWGGKVRRTVSGWRAGDVVELEGALRRRFYRGGTGTVTRLEVEVLSGRLLSRAETKATG
jgi:single-strand DNA-binding protein